MDKKKLNEVLEDAKDGRLKKESIDKLKDLTDTKESDGDLYAYKGDIVTRKQINVSDEEFESLMKIGRIQKIAK